MNLLEKYDWKKQAAQVLDDGQVEKAFMDQSIGYVANKASALMKAPYRLGFEVVYKNDKNTRMCGIFAFRIGDDLHYAPAFFLNGDIKGTDLFYRCTPKTFVPLTEDWVKFLISQHDQEMGHGINRSVRHKSPAHADLWKLAYPPNNRKMASADPVEPEDKKAAWHGFLDELATIEPLQPILRRFITEDGGVASVTKIASWMKDNFKFAECLALNCEEETYCPPELLASVKSSAAPVVFEPKLVLYTGGLQPGIKSASEFCKSGFELQDERMDRDISFVTEDQSHELTSVGSPGVFDILLVDGEMERAFCAPASDERVGDGHSGLDKCIPCGDWGGLSVESRFPRICVVLKSGASSTFAANKVLGTVVKDATAIRLENEDMLKDSMESKECYRIFNSADGTLSERFFVVSKEKVDESVTVYQVVHSYGAPTSLRHNVDYNGMDISGGTIGADAKFVKISGKGTENSHSSSLTPSYDINFDSDVRAATEGGLNDWILSHGIKQASLTHSHGEFRIRTGPKKLSHPLTKLAALVALARDFNMRGDDAVAFLTSAETTGRIGMLIDAPAHKRAAMTRVLDDPSFTQESNSTFGINEEQPQRFALDTEQQVPFPPAPRIGDAYDPGMGQGPQQDSMEDADGIGNDLLLSLPPEQLASMSQDERVPHIFEHGVVNSLVRTYDSVAMIDKYLPDLEQALDRLGRILFLFYWKPGDFQDAYGIDDMTDMESELLSNFKSFGDLVLDLLKKSRAKSRSNVALPT